MPPALRLLVNILFMLLAASAGAAPIIDITSSATRYVSVENIDVLLDPTHELSLEDVMRGSAASFSDQQTLQLGFTSSTVWLRLQVDRHPHAARTWWLVFDQPLLDLIRVYVPADDGTYHERRGGIYLPFGAREIVSRRPAFAVDLPADGPQAIYIRLNSRNSMSTGIQLIQPAEFSALTTREALAFGAFFGFYALTLLCYLLFWYWTREVVSGLYLLYLLFGAVSAALSTGYPQRQLLPDLPLSDVALVIPLGGILVSGMLFGIQILGVRKAAPRSATLLMLAACAITGAGFIAMMTDHITTALVTLEIGLLLSMTTLTAIAIVRALHRNPSAWLYLAAFSVMHVGTALRFLRDLGLTPINAWSENGLYIGITLHILIMSIAIFWRYDQLRRDKDQAQAAALEADLRALAERHAHREQREFMAMVSHEFRSPLAIIDVTVQNLIYSTREENDSRVPRYAKIQRAAERLSVLMNTYLSAERLEDRNDPPSMRTCDLTQLLSSVLLDIDTTNGPEVKLEIDSLDPQFACDPDSLRILMTNLLENARRHSRIDQPVTLRVSGRAPDALEVSVIDQGEGIPPDELPRLFQRFFRGRGAQRHPGAGLGLYLCQRIVRQHGGDIKVFSELGKGTEFKVWLPKRAPH
jgi:signal transduction histidine kinase